MVLKRLGQHDVAQSELPRLAHGALGLAVPGQNQTTRSMVGLKHRIPAPMQPGLCPRPPIPQLALELGARLIGIVWPTPTIPHSRLTTSLDVLREHGRIVVHLGQDVESTTLAVLKFDAT